MIVPTLLALSTPCLSHHFTGASRVPATLSDADFAQETPHAGF